VRQSSVDRWGQHRFDLELVHIPAGEFWMGSDSVEGEDDGYLGQPRHGVYLSEYWIARAPVTNAQFLPFVQATGHHMPDHWEGGRPLPGTERHPITFVSWDDARAYCGWLEEQLQVGDFKLKVWRGGQLATLNLQLEALSVRLPTEAEWEKAARGPDSYVYPWGDEWDGARCNTAESGREGTTPVDAFPQGASPYGVLDMAGNVWEWTSSVRRPYPYDAKDGRENSASGDSVRRDDIIGHGDIIRRSDSIRRVVRGGSFLLDRRYARCAVRYGSAPERRTWVYGFRVAISGVDAG
jgi:formylglycine-generating enzyme required for sulfatase activity